MTTFLYCLLLFVWGVAIIIAWVWMVINIIILLQKPKSSDIKSVAISSPFLVAVIASVFLLEGIGETKYIFDKDGTLAGTISPQVMSQKNFDAATRGKIVVSDSGFQTGPDASIWISIGDKIDAKILYWWDGSEDRAVVRTAGAAIRLGIRIERQETIQCLIMHDATNELATIKEKAKSIAYSSDSHTVAIAEADMASMILHELAPVMAHYSAYPKNVTVFTRNR
jgi:hypothetical protein